METNNHIENSLAKIKVIFQKASERIDALKSGEKIPATALAVHIATDMSSEGEPMKGPQLYSTLKFLLDGYPGVDVKRGAHGGIVKR
jgi:hypothetical protein